MTRMLLTAGFLATLAVAAGPHQGGARAQPLDGAEIEATAVGNTTIGTFADTALSYAVYLAPDGAMIGRLWDGGPARTEHGTWRIEGDRLVGRWDGLKGGLPNAFTYVRVGENVHALRDDGGLDRVQFFVAGDPLGLASGEDLERLFAAKLEEEYFRLWRDTPDEPFSFAEAEGIYVTDGRLTALDTDALAVPGQGSRLEGWEEYASVWPRAFEAIRSFVPGPVRDLNVRREGDWVLTDFDMAGEAVLESGEAVRVFKHFTLLWIRTDAGWRILHEHVSDSTHPDDL